MDMYLICLYVRSPQGQCGCLNYKGNSELKTFRFFTCDLMVAQNSNSNFDTPSPITSKPWQASIIGDINNGERPVNGELI
jgi:hypothetical protein